MSPASPKTQEPTMEEILASIRRIIADDQAAAAQADEPEDEPEPSPAPEPDEADEGEPQSQSAIDDMFADMDGDSDDDSGEGEDILDLGEVAEPVIKAHEPSPLDLEHEDIDFREAGIELDPELDEEPEPEPEEDFAFDEPEPEPFVPPPPRDAFEPRPEPRRAAFDEERLLSDATDAAVGGAFNMLAHTVLSNNGRTLDDLVKEMLRPMLKVWLDDNLPVIVERLVRAEIERVSRGR